MLIKTSTALIATFVIATTVGVAHAQTSKQASMDKKPISQVTCEEFIGLDDTFKPNAVAWAVGYKAGQQNPDVVAMDVDGVETITPYVVDECMKAPKASFWSKVEGVMKKKM